MCIRFSKAFTISFAIIILATSIGITVGGILIIVKSESLIDIIKPFISNSDIIKIAGYICIGFGILLSIITIAGIYGICKTKKIYISIYSIFVFLIMIVFLAIGISILVYINPLISSIEKDECKSTDSQ